jgi:DNA-binding response OmpR family regulator
MQETRKKILCIEDDHETATLVAEELTDRGFDVQVAHNGLEGFSAIQRLHPHLVLCDLIMPGASGLEVLKRLTAVAPRFWNMPFIFVTATADRDIELKARRLGADDFVTKPVDFDVLEAIICAVRWGRNAAIIAIFAAAGVVDFLAMPPVYSFAISDPRQIIELALFIFVALVTGHLASRLRSDVATLQRREDEIRNLYEFSRRLALCATARDLLKAIQDYLSAHLGCEAHLIHLAPAFGGEEEENGRAPPAIARQAGDMASTQESSSRVVTDPATKTLWVLKYIATTVAGHGVLAINLGTQTAPQ